MNNRVHPAVMSILLACVLGIVGYYLFHAATDKPYYPGWNVGPGGGPGMTKEQGEALSKSGAFPKGRVLGTEDPQAKTNPMNKKGPPAGAPGAPPPSTGAPSSPPAGTPVKP